MPSVEEQRKYWGEVYDWSELGDEWSAPWGNAETHWHATLLPRVWPFLPTGTVLEIAPGYGRWSGYLIDASERYVGVDIAEACVTACRERFEDTKKATFVQNDGRSLEAVEDGAVDFAFSFDSLVHAEADVIGDYLQQLAVKFSPEGAGFLHHSNLGEYDAALQRSLRVVRATRRVPMAERTLKRIGAAGWDQSRAPSMTARRFVELCEAAGLICIGQEIISWGRRHPRTVDCISLVARRGSRWERPNIVVRNPDFMAEARSAQAVAEIFTSLRSTAERRPQVPA